MHRSKLLILAGQDKLLWHLTSEPGDPPGCFHQSEATLKTRRRVLHEATSGKLWQPLVAHERSSVMGASLCLNP